MYKNCRQQKKKGQRAYKMGEKQSQDPYLFTKQTKQPNTWHAEMSQNSWSDLPVCGSETANDPISLPSFSLVFRESDSRTERREYLSKQISDTAVYQDNWRLLQRSTKKHLLYYSTPSTDNYHSTRQISPYAWKGCGASGYFVWLEPIIFNIHNLLHSLNTTQAI